MRGKLLLAAGRDEEFGRERMARMQAIAPVARRWGTVANDARVPLYDLDIPGHEVADLIYYCDDAYACIECGDGLALGWACRCGSTWRRLS